MTSVDDRSECLSSEVICGTRYASGFAAVFGLVPLVITSELPFVRFIITPVRNNFLLITDMAESASKVAKSPRF